MTTVSADSRSQSPASTASPLLRLEADFLRPYRGAIGLGLPGLLVQSVLLLPVPLLQGWVVDKLVALAAAGGGIAAGPAGLSSPVRSCSPGSVDGATPGFHKSCALLSGTVHCVHSFLRLRA